MKREKEQDMRVVGLDIHRSFAEAAMIDEGRVHQLGRIDLVRERVIAFAKRLGKTTDVVVEATGNTMAVVKLMAPHVRRMVIANPLQVRAIAHAKVKTDKIDAVILAKLHSAGFLPEVCQPSNNSAHDPNSGRSTHYGCGRLIRVFRDIGRMFSSLCPFH
jgi:hypothetical protein